MAQEIRVSKAGVNVLTATDPNDFIFHSSYNTFKILAEGTLLNQSISATPTEITVSHGQNPSIPVVFGFIKFPDGRVYLPDSMQPSTGTSFKRDWRIYVDDTNIIFRVWEEGGTYTCDIKYYVFETTI